MQNELKEWPELSAIHKEITKRQGEPQQVECDNCHNSFWQGTEARCVDAEFDEQGNEIETWLCHACYQKLYDQFLPNIN